MLDRHYRTRVAQENPDGRHDLLKGVDRSALGEYAWRKNVVLAPQFHENHVLADSFLFNLLRAGSGR